MESNSQEMEAVFVASRPMMMTTSLYTHCSEVCIHRYLARLNKMVNIGTGTNILLLSRSFRIKASEDRERERERTEGC